MASEGRAIEDRLERFFAGLEPVLRIARDAQRSLDRYVATEFSVFDYFRYDENAVSRILADLLDPMGSHGQGEHFLQSFLEMTELSGLPADPGLCRIRREALTADRRRVDILIECPGPPQFLIGIENKPWTADSERQAADYIAHLGARTGDNWAFFYLSRDGSPPDAVSLDEGSRVELQKQHRFRTVPYRSHDPSGCSLEAWLWRCRNECHADRVRWFLDDLIGFIGREFDRAEVDDEWGTIHRER